MARGVVLLAVVFCLQTSRADGLGVLPADSGNSHGSLRIGATSSNLRTSVPNHAIGSTFRNCLSSARRAAAHVYSPTLSLLSLRSFIKQEPDDIQVVEPYHGPQGHLNPSPTPMPIGAQIWWSVSMQLVYLLFAVLVAYFYKTNKAWFVGQHKPEKDFKSWTTPVLEPICCWSLLFPSVRWADTLSMTEIIPSYWQAFLLFFGVQFVASWFSVFGWIFMTLFLVFYRNKLREKNEMQSDYGWDCCCLCCCMPCVIAQEARHVEDASAAGVL